MRDAHGDHAMQGADQKQDVGTVCDPYDRRIYDLYGGWQTDLGGALADRHRGRTSFERGTCKAICFDCVSYGMNF